MENEHCLGGIPTVLSFFKNFEKEEEFIANYERMHSLTCE
jgi:hypothetical protein